MAEQTGPYQVTLEQGHRRKDSSTQARVAVYEYSDVNGVDCTASENVLGGFKTVITLFSLVCIVALAIEYML